jgi:phage shock protein E
VAAGYKAWSASPVADLLFCLWLHTLLTYYFIYLDLCLLSYLPYPMSFFSKLFAPKPSINYHELVLRGAVIVDVRTPGEYTQGHINGAINIPIGTVGQHVATLSKQTPVITYCASGLRSAAVRSMLAEKGFEAYNGGSQRRLAKAIGA